MSYKQAQAGMDSEQAANSTKSQKIATVVVPVKVMYSYLKAWTILAMT